MNYQCILFDCANHITPHCLTLITSLINAGKAISIESICFNLLLRGYVIPSNFIRYLVCNSPYFKTIYQYDSVTDIITFK